MQKVTPILLQMLFIIVVLSSFVYFGESKHSNITITVAVEPMRTIVVNKSLRIVQIISNTKKDVEPVVYLDTPDGIELPYSEGIRDQYLTLKPVLNFSKPGIVYERDDRIFVSLFKTVLSLVQKVLMINIQIQ